jgi:hypothetical protein
MTEDYARTYRQQVVRLHEAITSRSGPTLIQRVNFEDCDVYGPAVLILTNNVTLESCTFDAPPEILFIEGQEGRPYVGVIGLENVRFHECRMHNIAFLGPKALLNEFRQQLASQ